jgi:hypothetical protein
MKEKAKITDIRTVIEESARSFFLERRVGPTVRLNIHRTEPTRIFIGIPSSIPIEHTVTGFLIARGSGGVCRVRGDVEGGAGRSKVFDIAPVDLDMDSIVLENRREFFRCAFHDPPTATLTRRGEPTAWIVTVKDFAAGGMGIHSPSGIAVGTRFHVKFAPRLGLETRAFEFEAQVVADLGGLQPENPELRNHYGLWISTPDDPTPDALQRFDELQRRITKFCNEYAIRERKRARGESDPREE